MTLCFEQLDPDCIDVQAGLSLHKHTHLKEHLLILWLILNNKSCHQIAQLAWTGVLRSLEERRVLLNVTGREEGIAE